MSNAAGPHGRRPAPQERRWCAVSNSNAAKPTPRAPSLPWQLRAAGGNLDQIVLDRSILHLRHPPKISARHFVRLQAGSRSGKAFRARWPHDKWRCLARGTELWPPLLWTSNLKSAYDFSPTWMLFAIFLPAAIAPMPPSFIPSLREGVFPLMAAESAQSGYLPDRPRIRGRSRSFRTAADCPSSFHRRL